MGNQIDKHCGGPKSHDEMKTLYRRERSGTPKKRFYHIITPEKKTRDPLEEDNGQKIVIQGYVSVLVIDQNIQQLIDF